MDGEVIREADEKEKREYQELGTNRITVDDLFKKELEKNEKWMSENHKPFCRRCAKFDYEDKKEKLLTEKRRKFGASAEEQIQLKDLKLNWEEYKKLDRFILLDRADAQEYKILDGIRTLIHVGYHDNFQCKERGCRISVFIPLEKKK